MKESTSKEKVLKKIRDALVNHMPPPYEDVDMESSVMYVPEANRLDEAFAASFSASHGKFIFCSDVSELTEAWPPSCNGMTSKSCIAMRISSKNC